MRNKDRSAAAAGETVPAGTMAQALPPFPEETSYKANIANASARGILAASGAASCEPAYELAHPKGTRYCLKYELGLCPVHQGARPTGPLFLVNNGRCLALGFDCARCEMTVSAS